MNKAKIMVYVFLGLVGLALLGGILHLALNGSFGQSF